MDTIITLITLYNPTSQNIANARKIAEQSTLTFLIDNSPESNESLIDDSLSKKIVYCPNNDNLGISRAFNKYLMNTEIYNWKDEDYIVFFDQDSVIEEGHINSLVKEYKEIEKTGVKIGCIGPTFFDISRGSVRFPRRYKPISEKSAIVGTIITSSMVCRYKNLRRVGFWSEDIFLDMADWDMCWKMKKCGLATVMTKCCLLTHKISEGSKKVGPFTLRVAKPFREYYEIRDCVYILRKDYVPLKARIMFYLRLTIRPLLHILFLDDKEERKKYIKLGFKHAREGVTGKLSSQN